MEQPTDIAMNQLKDLLLSNSINLKQLFTMGCQRKAKKK